VAFHSSIFRRDALAASSAHRAQALGSLAPHLPPDQIAEALAAAKAIGDEGYRARALGSLASSISPSQHGVSMEGRPLPANPHERYPLVYPKVAPRD